MNTPSSQSNSSLTSFANLIFVAVAIAAYVPVILNPALRTLSPLRMVTLFGLGALYLVAGIYGWALYERFESRLAAIMYFAIQTFIIVAILWPGDDVTSSLWILLLPIVGQSVALSRAGTAAVCLGLLASFWLIMIKESVPRDIIVQGTLSMAAGMAFVLVFVHIAVRESEARAEIERLAAELGEANQKLREYAAQVEELATTKERNRLAREIHDSLGHYLTVINVQIEAARVVMAGDAQKALDALAKAQILTREGLAAVRQSVAALRESPTSHRPLAEAITSLAEETEKAGIMTEFNIKGEHRPLDSKVKLALYRVAQEGLTNVRKHARASRVDITLDYGQSDQVSLLIRDNGVGTAATGDDGFGLLGIRERVQLLGGDVRLETAPGQGFGLTVILPG